MLVRRLFDSAKAAWRDRPVRVREAFFPNALYHGGLRRLCPSETRQYRVRKENGGTFKLMKRTIGLMMTVALAAGAIGFAQRGGSTRLEGPLFGAGNDKGKAKWQTRDGRGQLQAELEVEGENLIPNETYYISIENNRWSVQANAFGAFEFVQRYIGPERPSISAGSNVFVTNKAGSSTLLGTLRAR